MSTNGRLIGIRHRRKNTTAGEARPTVVAIQEGGEIRELELPDDEAELDFMLGRFPTGYRRVTEGDDLSQVLPRHVKLRKHGEEDVHTIPSGYEGFAAGDTVVMTLGGSGDRLAYALSRRAEGIGAHVFRIPPFRFAEARGDAEKDDDHKLLITMFERNRDAFYEVTPRDRAYIRVVECFHARRDAQLARIACEQRLYQRTVGQIFLSEEGHFPEGTMQDAFDAVKANDLVLQSLITEEKKRTSELQKAVRALPVWDEIFAPIEGCGEVLAAALITAVQDIRRFETKAKFKAFLGVHCLSDGRFARRRKGEVANWSPEGRQALFLLGEQWNKRPTSVWGMKLREWKRILRERHPEVEVLDGKKRYTDGHIHKMGLWRTRTKFVEFLFKHWWELERRSA